MKKLSLAILFLPLLFQACKKEDVKDDTFANLLKSAGKVRVLSPADYPSDLVSSVDGEIYIQAQSNQKDVVYGSAGILYNFNGSILTSSSVTVDVSTPTATQTYTFSTTDAVPGYMAYNTQSTGTNPTYLSSYFTKNVTVQLNIGGAVAQPTSGIVNVPSPIMITAPAVDPSVPNSDNVTTSSVIEWGADASNKNGVIVRLENIPETGTSTVTMLLVPDNGSLYLADISSYLPISGRFEIELSRLSYTIITKGTKKYRVVGATTSISRYNMTN
jgi:hypothetical protein